MALDGLSQLVVCFILFQYFTQLWEIKGQIFVKSAIFQVNSLSLKTIKRSNIKLPSDGFSINSEQSGVLLRFLDRIFVTYKYNIPEGNSVALAGKTALRQTWSMTWLTSDSVNKHYKQVFVTQSASYSVSESRNPLPPKRYIHYRYLCMGSTKVSHLEWP